VQASYMKNLFAALDAKGQLATLAAADPELAREVAAASRVTWLPISLNLRTVEAIVGTVGEERGLRLLADCVYAQFGTALWKGFVGGALRQPPSACPGAPGRSHHAYGERSAEAEPTVSIHGLPAALAAHGLWLRHSRSA
jgi:hypothetical protein